MDLPESTTLLLALNSSIDASANRSARSQRESPPQSINCSQNQEPSTHAQESTTSTKAPEKRKWELNTNYTFKPIGFIDSCFPTKNGTPRQPIIAKHARAKLTVDFGVPNPHFAFDGLAAFSHVWLIFLFHDNKSSTLHLKVNPPRLEGQKMGLFATRTPHRPNPFGLSVVKLDKIEGNVLYLSGIDLIHGTPIIDIKPYIPEYDSVPTAVSPDWIRRPPRERMRTIVWMPAADEHLQKLLPLMRFYDNAEDIRAAIEEVATEDPRSTHWKTGKYGDLYGFCIDILNVVLKFDDSSGTCVVLDVEDWSNGKPTNEESTAAPATMPPGLLHERTRTAEVGAVHWALQAYPDAVKSVDAEGQTALHLAASLGYIDICKLLVANGADLNARDNRNMTPFLVAARGGLLDTCITFAPMSNVAAVNHDNSSALHMLCNLPNPVDNSRIAKLRDIFRMLAESGLDFNAMDKTGRAPLHYTCFNRSGNIAQLLLENASVNCYLATKEGESPLAIATRLNDAAMCSLLNRHLAPSRPLSLTAPPLVPSPTSSSFPLASVAGDSSASKRHPSEPISFSSAVSSAAASPSSSASPITSVSPPPPAENFSSPRPRFESRSEGWARAMSPHRRYIEERKDMEKRVFGLEQLLKQQEELIKDKEAAIAALERQLVTLSPAERDVSQRALADLHKQLAEQRFAKFKTQKAIKADKASLAELSGTTNTPPASPSTPPSAAAQLRDSSRAPQDRFKGAVSQADQKPPSPKAPPPPPTEQREWLDLLVAAGVDEGVANLYQRMWVNIPVPEDKCTIPFSTMKAMDGVKLGHLHKLMKHLGIPLSKLT